MTEIDVGRAVWVVAFSASGEYLVSGNDEGVAVWRVEDTRQIARKTTGIVNCLAVSKNGKWIAAGTDWSCEVFVWDAQTEFKEVFRHKENTYAIRAVDFSPRDSTRLVFAAINRTASIWNFATCEQVVGTLDHRRSVVAAKYSPTGDRIATATHDSVRVWDSKDGRLLVEIPVRVTPLFNTGLVWSNNSLFAVSGGNIKKMGTSTGSLLSEWPVINNKAFASIALSGHGEFIAYFTDNTVTVSDTTTHSQLGVIKHLRSDIRSIAISPDDRLLAIGGEGGKVTIRDLSRISDSILISCLHSTFQEPDIRIDDAALDSWKHDHLEYAEQLLTAEISESQDPRHHVLANRALVRARLRKWDAALADAEKSVKIQPSVIGYIAKSVAHVGNGERHKGYQACDNASEYFDSHATFLLLIKAIVMFMAEEHHDAISHVDDLITAAHPNSICYVAYMYLLLGNVHMESNNYDDAIRSFEHARAQVRPPPIQSFFVISLITGWKFDNLETTIRQRLCEALHSAGRTNDASESLLELINTFEKEAYMGADTVKWISDITQRCLATPKSDGDAALASTQHTNAPTRHTNPSPLLKEWARATLVNHSWKDALPAAVGFVTPRFDTYRVVCEQLEVIDRITDAVDCFHEMASEFRQKTDSEQEKWIADFKSRCGRKLEELGDLAMSTRQYDQAISRYSAALSLDLTDPQALFVNRSKAHANMGLWEDALNDAIDVIMLRPSSPSGYERKHAALHGAGRYRDARDAFETMLSKMSKSSDPEIRERSLRYASPAQTEAAIREAIQEVIQESPLILINTDSGRLLDKPEQASSFESQPSFHELISSMTTEIDRSHIQHEVGQYYRYAMFSHKWKDNEPLFEKVIHIVVYELEESPAHDKLQMFCKIVRDAGLHWAWSDTCCVNKADSSVLQEALVSMFQWYQGSTMTIVLLCDIPSPSRRGDLVRSIWNTRAWTLQEYHASKAVRFYNKDWTLYRNLDVPNHKESPEIISEMEEATGIPAQTLMTLRPGSEDIREKLRLASTRQTTRVEDAAYSLLGIFSLSLPVVYGEGDKALGRLLAQLLTSSGDTSILAWTGRSGGFNSCLPAKTFVFNQSPTSHIPPAITSAEMESITTRLRSSSLNLNLITTFYDRLDDLRVPWFAGKRMTLPCIAFKLGPLSVSRNGSEHVFRAQTGALGIVEIRTEEHLSRFDSLYLIHPWIDFLLDRQPVGSVLETITEKDTPDQPPLTNELPSIPRPSHITSAVPQPRTSRLASRLGLLFGGRAVPRPRDTASLQPPSTLAQTDKQIHALRVIARLGQPFGALLLTPDHGNVAAYRRVATESLITVRVEEITPTILNKLIDSVRVLDVL